MPQHLERLDDGWELDVNYDGPTVRDAFLRSKGARNKMDIGTTKSIDDFVRGDELIPETLYGIYYEGRTKEDFYKFVEKYAQKLGVKIVEKKVGF